MKIETPFIFLLIFILVPTSSVAFAKREHPENWYQDKWCRQNNGQAEFVFPDKTRCDCLTATHAIEFDFGDKWAEAIGQALYYGIQTGKRSGIVLIIEKDSDRKYWIRLNSVIQHYNLLIDTWAMGRGG